MISLNTQLQNEPLDITQIISLRTKEELIRELKSLLEKKFNSILKKPEYLRNVLLLTSFLYTYEQSNKQKNENNNLSVDFFDDEFTNKLILLSKHYEQSPSLSR